MTGIIVADSNEINKFPFKIKEVKKISQFKFTLFNNDVIVVYSGIGIANSAAATQSLIDNFKIKEIINYGAVGGNKNVKVFDLITPEKIFYHDVTTPWYKRGQTPGEKEFFTNSLISNKNNNIASGSSFLTDKSVIKKANKELNVDIFDMEIAAIAQIADKNDIPLKVIKCVSDAIGFEDESIGNINQRIEKAGKIAFKRMLEEIK